MILTFTYFYPGNEVIFLSEQLPGTETLKKASSEWGRMNRVRSFTWLAGLLCCGSGPDEQSPPDSYRD